MRKYRKPTPPNLRQAVFERDGFRCRYCGTDKGPFHADHVYPISRGGETTIDNLVTACVRCNGKKRDTVGMWPNPLPIIKAKKLTSFWMFILGAAIIYIPPMTLKTAFSVINQKPVSPAPEVFYVCVLIGAIPVLWGLILKLRGGQA